MTRASKVDRDKIDKIEIQRGAETISMLKSGSGLEACRQPKASVGQNLRNAERSRFRKSEGHYRRAEALATYGLDKPKLEVVLRQGSTELVRVGFGSDSKMPEGIYLKTSDSPP